MKYVDEFRDAERVQRLSQQIHQQCTRPWTIMEICGGQTHAIVRFGLDTLLPPGIQLIHGPGCPVCVTPTELIDAALELSGRDNLMFCSFGDMLRVPGSNGDLMSAQAAGADVRVVYSPLDAVTLARDNPERDVVFFAVGFETTAPANALAVEQAAALQLENFSLLVSHVLVPPAIAAILEAEDNRVQGFLAAGHVCTVMGCSMYQPLVDRFQVPIVVTGFEPVDIMRGIASCVAQLERGQSRVDNQYARSVREGGNQQARHLIEKIFCLSDRRWRGMGSLSASGLALRPAYARFDATQRYAVDTSTARDDQRCISGEILRGVKKPMQCPAFGKQCTPEHPLGATMVSNEGACAAYYHYRHQPQEQSYDNHVQ